MGKICYNSPVTEPIHRKEINEAMKLGIVGLPNVGKSTLSMR